MVKKFTIENIFDETHKFCDSHLYALQNTLYVLFGGTVLYLGKRLYLGKEFRSPSEIPLSFIEKSIALRGKVLNVNKNGSLLVKHLPVINFSRYNPFFSSASGKASSTGISVKLAGLNLSDAHQSQILQELEKLKNKRIWMEIIYRDDDKDDNENEQSVHCLVSRQLMFINFYINYRLLRRGLAQVGPLPKDVSNKKMIEKLFKAQKKAIFWKRGMWKTPGRWF